MSSVLITVIIMGEGVVREIIKIIKTLTKVQI